MFVEVPIVCKTAKISELQGLGINFDASEYEVRIGKINKEKIIIYYPTGDTNQTIVECSTGCYTLEIPYSEFDKLICS